MPLHTDPSGQNPAHWQHHVLVRMRSSRSSLALLVYMQNGTATSEDSLEDSEKTKHTPTV